MLARAHGPEGANHGLTFSPEVRALSDNDRFATVYIPTTGCDQCRYAEDVARLDLKRNRFNNVIDGRQRRRSTRSRPPTTAAGSRSRPTPTTCSTASSTPTACNAADVYSLVRRAAGRGRGLAHHGLAEARLRRVRVDRLRRRDRVLRLVRSATATRPARASRPSTSTPTRATTTIKLTIEDDGGNEVVYAFEVVAIKGILTTGAQPIDFIGVDKHLRCSVVRDGPLLADGGGACGTFVALGGKTYGPPDLIEGTENYTPVSQELHAATATSRRS